jgi:hypothetical protein
VCIVGTEERELPRVQVKADGLGETRVDCGRGRFGILRSETRQSPNNAQPKGEALEPEWVNSGRHGRDGQDARLGASCESFLWVLIGNLGGSGLDAYLGLGALSWNHSLPQWQATS